MKKIKFLLSFVMLFVLSLSFVACGNSSGNNNQNSESDVAEKVEFATAKIRDVEFKNSKAASIEQKNNIVTITGILDAMSDSQKEAYNKSGITHAVSLKFKFDKERTLSKFEISGNETKVYSDTKDVANYAGSISDLLDSEDKEDSFAYLVLSANTSEYKLISTYTDGTVSTIKIKITATLATATSE